jgi:hypothetical protein
MRALTTGAAELEATRAENEQLKVSGGWTLCDTAMHDCAALHRTAMLRLRKGLTLAQQQRNRVNGSGGALPGHAALGTPHAAPLATFPGTRFAH